MTSKEYLNQAYYIDKSITGKLEVIDNLNTLATRCTSTINDTPVQRTRNLHRTEDVIAKIVDFENEVTEEIDMLVDTKREIYSVISRVTNQTHRLMLEMRYLRFMTWENIAVTLNLEISWVHRLHKRALEDVRKIMDRKQ